MDAWILKQDGNALRLQLEREMLPLPTYLAARLSVMTDTSFLSKKTAMITEYTTKAKDVMTPPVRAVIQAGIVTARLLLLRETKQAHVLVQPSVMMDIKRAWKNVIAESLKIMTIPSLSQMRPWVSGKL